MKTKVFSAIFFGIIAYMYTATVANYIGYTYSVFQFAEKRSPILIGMVILGVLYVGKKNGLKISFSNYKKTAFFDVLYDCTRISDR